MASTLEGVQSGAQQRRGVLAGGNWLVDHVKIIDAWPPQDGLANIIGRSSGNGGGPYNVLKDLAKLGATFPLAGVGVLGNDADGSAIRADCRAHGIDTAQLHVSTIRATSSTDVMTVHGTGRRTFFHDRGANALLAPEHFDFTTTSAKVFYLGYLLLLDALDAPGAAGVPRAAEVLGAARAAGLLTVMDCVSASADHFRATVAPVLPGVDILLANDFEAEQLTGLSLGRGETLDRAAVERAARQLAGSGIGGWAILHFPEAACAASSRGELVWQASVKVPAGDVAGTAGAGDAFAAGVIYGVHEGWPMARALELGVCTAAASLYHPTCSDSVRPVAECLALGARFGFRS